MRNAFDPKNLGLQSVKKVLAIYAPENFGKTTTLKELIKLFEGDKRFSKICDRPSSSYEMNPTFRGEALVIYECNGVRIGISTAGDDKTVIIRNVRYFAKYKCDIVIVPVRTQTAGGRPAVAVSIHEEIVKHLEIEETKIDWTKRNITTTTQKITAKEFYSQIEKWVMALRVATR